MVVGVVTEIKPGERRVALTPTGALELTRRHMTVVVEQGAGEGSGFTDAEYEQAGAEVCSDAAEVWGRSCLLLKVKEPIESEYPLLRSGLVLFTYLHLAANRPLIEALLASEATAIAYETVQDAAGSLPLLAPMSEIAGRVAAQAGAFFLQDPMGGNGTLIGGAAGVRPARVLVVGGGVVGSHAARVAAGMGGDVVVLERSQRRIRQLNELFGGVVTNLMSDPPTLERELSEADVVIGAVLVPGAVAPHLISRSSLRGMKRRALIVDVAVDQGGCAETSRPTTHEEPTYVVDGVLHYCVANMPAAVPTTSTRALTNATLPYVLRLAEVGLDEAFARDEGFARGLNIRNGEILHQAVADSYREPRPAITGHPLTAS